MFLGDALATSVVSKWGRKTLEKKDNCLEFEKKYFKIKFERICITV
jgi:hypothetical protein